MRNWISDPCLAIDCSENQCSATLVVGENVLLERSESQGRRHSEFLLPAIDGLLTEANMPLPEIKRLIFTRGPGAFTGLRIALAAIQGLSFAANIPMYPVSTLLSLAYAGHRRLRCSNVLAVMDARMNQVYLAGYRFDQQGYKTLIPEQVVDPQRLSPVDIQAWQQDSKDWCCVGSGSGYQEALETTLGAAHCVEHNIVSDEKGLTGATAVFHCAQALLDASDVVAPGQVVEPTYLRDDVVQVKTKG